MFEFNKSTIKQCSGIQRTSPRLLVASTSRLATSVPFASIATPSSSPSPSPSYPSLFAFMRPTSIAAIVLASSSSTVAVVFVAAAWAPLFAFLPPPRRPPPTMTTIGDAYSSSSSSFLPLLRHASPAPSPSPSPSQSSGSSPRWRRRRPAPDDSRPRQPLPPPLLVLLAPAALLAPLRAFAPADHPHFSPPAPIDATAPPPFVVAARMLPHP